mgnify:CR=1 FL=1
MEVSIGLFCHALNIFLKFNPNWGNTSNIPGNDSVIVSLGCNTHKQWTFSLEGVTIVVTGIGCLAAPLPITTTPAITTPTTTVKSLFFKF